MHQNPNFYQLTKPPFCNLRRAVPLKENSGFLFWRNFLRPLEIIAEAEGFQVLKNLILTWKANFL